MNSSIRVLIVDNDESMINEVVKYFSSHEVIEVVACKKDGEEGLEYILNNPNKFDLIIMDLILPKCDGIFILNEMQKRDINKNVIIATSFKEDAMLTEVNKCGVNYYMLKPYNLDSLTDIIKRIVNNQNKTRIDNKDLQQAITNLLHSLGMPSHIKGYSYIRDSINLMYNKPSMLGAITKELYPEIANMYDTTSSRVERAIRHAIEVSWTRGDYEVMEEIFGHSVDYDRAKPTNSEFIATLADKLRLEIH